MNLRKIFDYKGLSLIMEFFPKVIVRFIFWSVVTQGHGSWTGKVCLSTKSRLYKVYKGLSLIMEFFPKVIYYRLIPFIRWGVQ